MPSRKATERCLEATTKTKDERQQHEVRFDIAQAVATGPWILQLNNYNATINIIPDLTLMHLCLYHLLDVNLLFKLQRQSRANNQGPFLPMWLVFWEGINKERDVLYII